MKYVLLVCTHDAGRLQTAQAFFERECTDKDCGAVPIAVIRALVRDITPQDAAEAVLPHADGRATATAPAG